MIRVVSAHIHVRQWLVNTNISFIPSANDKYENQNASEIDRIIQEGGRVLKIASKIQK